VCMRARERTSERVNETLAIFFHCCFVYGFTINATFRKLALIPFAGDWLLLH
jgi:hypothetical protein